MKAHHKRIRWLRRLALAGCVAGLAVPATANAMLPDRPVASASDQQQPYTLPSSFHTEVQSSGQQSQQPYTLPARFHTEAQTAPQPSSSPTATVIRQIDTVTKDGSRTLAIVLAAVALAVALGSLAYATIRVTQIQRRGLQSGSH